MLRVKTVVKHSQIEGVGLFADQNIKKGEAVWQFTPETCATFTEQQIKELTNSHHKPEIPIILYYLTYCYYQKNLNSLIYCLDNGRYVNHAERPTLGNPQDPPLNGKGWQYSVALRDIEKGEELTENYNTYDPCEWLDDLCRNFGIIHYQLEEAIR